MIRLGLVTVGQGPRPEYGDFHDHLLSSLGAEVVVAMRHALDGVSEKTIRSLAAGDHHPAIHCNIRGNESDQGPLGRGWTEVWLDRDRLAPFIARRITELEESGEAEVILICVAEEFPRTSFPSRIPVVWPWISMLNMARFLLETRPDGRVGILVYGSRQRKQQLETWGRQRWASRATLHFEEIGRSLIESARRLVQFGPDLVLLWGYGLGLARGNPPNLITTIRREINASVIVPHVASCYAIRQLIDPPIEPAEFLLKRTAAACGKRRAN